MKQKCVHCVLCRYNYGIFDININGSSPSRPKPLFQREAKCEAIEVNSFFYEKRFCSYPCFENESFWNSEMAY